MKIRQIVIISILAFAIIFCSVVCFVSINPQQTISAEDILTIMTFNVRVDTNPLDPSSRLVPYDTVSQRSALMAAHIKSGDPDIICCQEWMTSHGGRLLKELREKYNMIAVSRSPSNPLDEKCPIFYNKTRFELVETKTFWLSETPDTPSIGWDAKYYRICTTAVFYDKITEKTFRISNTHLEATKGTANERGRRLVTNFTADSKEPAILCGDFNFNTQYSSYRLMAYKLDDSRVLAPNAITTASYSNYKTTFLRNGYGYPIDHIFLQKDQFTVHSYEVLNYLIDGKFSSDHFPVIARVTIND